MIWYDFIVLASSISIIFVHILNFLLVVNDHHSILGMVFLNNLFKLYEEKSKNNKSKDDAKNSKQNDDKNTLKYFVPNENVRFYKNKYL